MVVKRQPVLIADHFFEILWLLILEKWVDIAEQEVVFLQKLIEILDLGHFYGQDTLVYQVVGVVLLLLFFIMRLLQRGKQRLPHFGHDLGFLESEALVQVLPFSFCCCLFHLLLDRFWLFPKEHLWLKYPQLPLFNFQKVLFELLLETFLLFFELLRILKFKILDHKLLHAEFEFLILRYLLKHP